MEKWKPIFINEEKTNYEVSNKGRVRNIERLHWKTGGVLTPKFNKHNGYESYGIVVDGVPHYKYAHRLVAIAFLEKPEEADFVNHIDGNKRNNVISNLEWVNRRENMRHAFENNLVSSVQEVKVYSLKGDLIGHYHSISEALRKLGIKEDQYNNRINIYGTQSHGYQWRRVGVDDHIPVKDIYDEWIALDGCVQLTLDGEFVKHYEKVAHAYKELNKPDNGLISQVCRNNRKTAHGYRWMYAKEYYKTN